jgi:hypothetical protein
MACPTYDRSKLRRLCFNSRLVSGQCSHVSKIRIHMSCKAQTAWEAENVASRGDTRPPSPYRPARQRRVHKAKGNVSGAQAPTCAQVHKSNLGHPSQDRRSVRFLQRTLSALQLIGVGFFYENPLRGSGVQYSNHGPMSYSAKGVLCKKRADHLS